MVLSLQNKAVHTHLWIPFDMETNGIDGVRNTRRKNMKRSVCSSSWTNMWNTGVTFLLGILACTRGTPTSREVCLPALDIVLMNCAGS